MKRLSKVVLFIALCSLALSSIGCLSSIASHLPKEREEFRQSYPLSPNGTISLKNVNGPISIKVWNESRVEINAVKEASSSEVLQQLKIDVKAQGNSIDIDTIYPKGKNTNASVAYELSVPSTANLKGIESVNGAISINGVEGHIAARTVNGSISIEGGNTVEAETVNGSIKASLQRLEGNQEAKYHTVNGSITLLLSEAINANVEAATLNGKINSDLPLQVQGKISSKQLKGKLGGGGALLSLETVNGSIHLSKDKSKLN